MNAANGTIESFEIVPKLSADGRVRSRLFALVILSFIDRSFPRFLVAKRFRSENVQLGNDFFKTRACCDLSVTHRALARVSGFARERTCVLRDGFHLCSYRHYPIRFKANSSRTFRTDEGGIYFEQITKFGQYRIVSEKTNRTYAGTFGFSFVRMTLNLDDDDRKHFFYTKFLSDLVSDFRYVTISRPNVSFIISFRSTLWLLTVVNRSAPVRGSIKLFRVVNTAGLSVRPLKYSGGMFSSAGQRTPSVRGHSVPSRISRIPATPTGPATGIPGADGSSVPGADRWYAVPDNASGSDRRPDSAAAAVHRRRARARDRHRHRAAASVDRPVAAAAAATDHRGLHGRADRLSRHQPAVRLQLGKITVGPGRRVPSAAHTRHERAVFQGHDDHRRGVQQTVRRRDLFEGTKLSSRAIPIDLGGSCTPSLFARSSAK